MTVRVLLVDDSTAVRRLLVAILEGTDGHWSVVGEAGNGRDAIEMARINQPDLVLLDLSMPVMDGLEALPQILAMAPRAAVVVLSGFPSQSARAAAVRAGASHYLEKDALVETLIPQLRHLLPELSDLVHTAHESAGFLRPALAAECLRTEDDNPVVEPARQHKSPA